MSDSFLPRVILVVLVAAFSLSTSGQQRISTKPIECFEVEPGKTAKMETSLFTSAAGDLVAFGTLELSRDASDDDGKSCVARFTLLAKEQTPQFRVVKAFTEQTEWAVGVEIVGLSTDHSKLAADFWWAGGDYTGHRPVIYDRKTGDVLFGKLEDQITKQLPSCDYFEDFIGVTDSGEAIIHVPKSIYVDQGCADQGRWLLDLRTGEVRRLPANRR